MRLPKRKVKVLGLTGAFVLAGAGVDADLNPLQFGGGFSLKGVCPEEGRALVGVYEPERLELRNHCQEVSGIVASVSRNPDGDHHVDLVPDEGYEWLLNGANEGQLVTEIMPRDLGRLPVPKVGDHLTLVGAYVTDTPHGWNEIHPMWAERWDDGRFYTSGSS